MWIKWENTETDLPHLLTGSAIFVWWYNKPWYQTPVLTITFFLLVLLSQGGVPEQVLLWPGLQVPTLLIWEHPGGTIRRMIGDPFPSLLCVCVDTFVCMSPSTAFCHPLVIHLWNCYCVWAIMWSLERFLSNAHVPSCTHTGASIAVAQNRHCAHLCRHNISVSFPSKTAFTKYIRHGLFNGRPIWFEYRSRQTAITTVDCQCSAGRLPAVKKTPLVFWHMARHACTVKNFVALISNPCWTK